MFGFGRKGFDEVVQANVSDWSRGQSMRGRPSDIADEMIANGFNDWDNGVARREDIIRAVRAIQGKGR